MSVEYDKLFLLDKINNRAECRNCDTVYSFERGSTGYSTLSIREGKIRRYPDTRWNARYDKLQEAIRIVSPGEQRNLEKTEKLLKPLIPLLNYA